MNQHSATGSGKSPQSFPMPQHRRGFLYQSFTLVVGGLIGMVPVAASLAMFLDPLRHSGKGTRVKIGPLDAVPAGGAPVSFPIIADKRDAWNLYRNQPIGAVWLRRETESDKVTALSATCPHAGCYVDYQAEHKAFKCPCHNSTFLMDGERGEPCVSPRPMDALECEVVNGEVYVVYQDFLAGIEEKKPK